MIKYKKFGIIFLLLLLVSNSNVNLISAQELSNNLIVTSQDSSDSTESNSDETAEDIYDYSAMENLNIENMDVSQYGSLEELVYDLMAAYDLDESQVGFAYTNLETQEEAFVNEDEQMIVASMYKVPMVAMYIDLINQGLMSWDSELPYSEEYYQDGAGDITADPTQDYYRLDELAYQAIVYSDNTASLILYYYYVNNFGSFRDGLLSFVDYYDVPEIYYYDNYGSAYIMNLSLQKIAMDPTYSRVTELMMESTPKQFFSLLVNNIATKYGRYENMLNDSGIYYEDDQPLYTLLVMVRDDLDAEMFISELSLRVNEWFQANRV